jgi:hypothetical protein
MAGLAPLLRLTLYGFAGLALIAGLLLFIGAEDTEDWFSWTIAPPLSASALGAFYWSAFVLLLTGARAPSWRAARPIVQPVLVIATVLLVVTLVHLDRFDLDSLFGLFWLCAYIAAPLLLIRGIALQRRRPDGDAPALPLPTALRAGIALQGGILAGLGVLMLLAPDAATDIWPWPLTPLVCRALGAFVLGVGLVALMVARDGRVVQVAGLAGAYAVLGALQLLAVAMHEPDLGGDDLATGIYLGFCGLIAASGVYGLSIAARASARS